MAIISLAGLLKSSTVLWLIGVSYHQPKEHRDTSLAVICQSDYPYGYKTCDDLLHYVTPTEPGQSYQPDFIGDHPFIYKSLYGQTLDSANQERIALAAKRYEEWKCSKHFEGYHSQYESLQQKDLIKYLSNDVMPRVGKENADREIDKKRAKNCNGDVKRSLRRRMPKQGKYKTSHR